MKRERSHSTISGLYAVTPDAPDTAVLLEQVEAALRGGARVLQYRNKLAAPAIRLEQARALKALCALHGVPLIVNDHLDVAQAVDADGLHLGAEDGSASVARQALGAGKIIGVSCYNRLDLAHAAQHDGADYIAFGSFFSSSVKPGAVRATLDLLATARRELDLPLVAIGGITTANAHELIAAGADALAVISALFAAPDIGAAARRFTTLFELSP